MALPKNNLSTLSQPWAREVEKLIVNTQSTLSKNEINNVARDAQLAASYRRLDTAVTNAAAAAQTANDAILGLTSLGSTSSEYTINAGNINAGILTGITIRTAASGRRVILSGDDIEFYDYSGGVDKFGGRITAYPGDYFSAPALIISNGTTASSAITVGSNRILLGVTGSSIALTSTQTTINSTVPTLISGSLVQMTGPTEVASSFSVSSNATFNGNVFAPMISGVTAAANMRWSTSGNGQFFYSTSSSARYKENIVDITSVPELDPKKLLNLPVRGFTYKQDYNVATDDSRYLQMIPGLIAEEVAEHYPLGADYEDGVVESWNERMILPGMLALIQDLYKEIAELKGAN